MSLLSTKSWNPRSAKNRARVERDEAEAKASEASKASRSREMESEWRYERLKASSLTKARDSTDAAQSSTSAPGLANALDPSVSGHQCPSNASSTTEPIQGHPLGGNKRILKPWYEYDEYALPKSASLASDTRREDPLTLMSSLEGTSKSSDTVSHRYNKRKDRSDPLGTTEMLKTKLQLLREERLLRERQERNRVAKLGVKRAGTEPRGRMTRYGPLRGDD